MLDFNPKTEWNLQDYFYQNIEDPQIQIDIEEIITKTRAFIEKYKGKITELKPLEFIDFFNDDGKIDALITKVGTYYFLASTLNTQDQDTLKKNSEFENILTDLSNQTAFIQQEFKSIGYDKLIELSKNPELKDYQNFFLKKAESIKFILDEKVEIAINLKEQSGVNAFDNLYEEFTNSFVFKIEKEGEIKEMTSDQIRSLRMSPDEDIRKKAVQSIREVYQTKLAQITLGNTYSAIVKDWVNDTKLRGYSGVMDIRNQSEQIPNQAIDTLLDEVEKAYPIYHKYLKLKAKMLGKEVLNDWDLFAPTKNEQKEILFEEGLNIYLENIKTFDQEFYEYSKSAFEKGRVDVFPKSGKRSGAFCLYDAHLPSFVMLNYTNKVDDVSTIAHEFGHSIHAYLSTVQKPQVYFSGISMAETASIFNETLLNETLLKTIDDKEKVSFLENNLQEIFSTIFRQIQYVLFERRVHNEVFDDKHLSYQDYNKMWREEQEKLTGGQVIYSVEADKEIGWSGIPHIFNTPFYCYSYSFGNILSFALYQKYREEGQSFIENYKNILRSGGSKSPYDLLIEHGLDITTPEFYRSGIKVISDMVDELENLVV